MQSTPSLPEDGSFVIREGSEFITVRAEPKDVSVLRMDWIKSRGLPIAEIGIRAVDINIEGQPIVTVRMTLIDRSKITQLLEMVEVQIQEFYRSLKANPGAASKILEKAIENYEDHIYFKAHWYANPQYQDGGWYAHAITTSRHVTVPHQVLEDKIKTRFKEFNVVREQMQFTPVWHIHLRDWDLKDLAKNIIDKLAAFIVVSGGRNVKRGRIKVIPLVKIGSCDNTIRAVEYIEINHTIGWEARFDEALDTAHQMLTKVREVIRMAATTGLSDDTAEKIIREEIATLKIRTEKHEMVVQAIMNRLRQKKAKTLWGVSQAITYVGSYPEEMGIEDITTEHAQEQLQAMGYRVMEKIMTRTTGVA